MQEKKRPEKIKLLPELERSVTEILVAQGRSFEPFIKTFSYSGENITKFSLGTLVGVFEVDEKSEDSAYIVNFLTSVAKKEYFSNPRRGAVESFEASLHKINLALAELVKHGNVAWLGKFHGALGIFEKNNFHFSVTGEAKIILFRNENLSDIAAGLASEESHIHPIKTFIEVSSGRLMIGDKVLLSAPELFHLFSFEDLRKNALRMDEERFKQFLKTALVNELDMTGAIVTDIKEAILPAPEKAASREKNAETDSQKTIKNVFSQSAFATDKKEESIEQTLAKTEAPPVNEYIDSKTGHIYIQGDTPEEPSNHPLFERFILFTQEVALSLRSAILSQGKWMRKLKKQSAIALDTIVEEAQVAGHRTFRAIRKQWSSRTKKNSLQVTPTLPQERLSPSEPTKSAPIPQPKKIVTDIPVSREEVPLVVPQTLPSSEDSETTEIFELPEPTVTQDDDISPFIKAKLAAFYGKGSRNIQELPLVTSPPETTGIDYREKVYEKATLVSAVARRAARFSWQTLKRWVSFSLQILRTIAENSFAFYKKLAPLHKKIVIAIIAVFIVIIGSSAFFILRNEQPHPIATSGNTPEPSQSSALPFIQDEKNAHEVTPITITTGDTSIVDTVLLGDTLFLISQNNIIDVRENKRYPLPDGSGIPKFVSAMDDLRLIFIYTEQGELFAWSPISRTFAKNTLNLPAGTKVQGIGTYLTYLYILDSTTNQIYRFPRADGGFGAPTNWLRDTITLGENALMAINETVFIAPDKTSVQAFFRGRFVRNLESPQTPLSLINLYTHPDLTSVYAIDTEHKRILIWNQDGNLLAQYFSEKIAEATSITVDEKNNEIFFTTGNTLLSIKMGGL